MTIYRSKDGITKTNIPSPCRYCNEREINCHSRCKRYKRFKEQAEERRLANCKRKEINADFNDFIVKHKIRTIKNKRR